MNNTRVENSLQTALRWTKNAAWVGYTAYVANVAIKAALERPPSLEDLPRVEAILKHNRFVMASVRDVFVEISSTYHRLTDNYVGVILAENSEADPSTLRPMDVFVKTEAGRRVREELMPVLNGLIERLNTPDAETQESVRQVMTWMFWLDDRFIAYREDKVERDGKAAIVNRDRLKKYLVDGGHPIPAEIDSLPVMEFAENLRENHLLPPSLYLSERSLSARPWARSRMSSEDSMRLWNAGVMALCGIAIAFIVVCFGFFCECMSKM
jgi:hypothetical protein